MEKYSCLARRLEGSSTTSAIPPGLGRCSVLRCPCVTQRLTDTTQSAPAGCARLTVMASRLLCCVAVAAAASLSGHAWRPNNPDDFGMCPECPVFRLNGQLSTKAALNFGPSPAPFALTNVAGPAGWTPPLKGVVSAVRSPRLSPPKKQKKLDNRSNIGWPGVYETSPSDRTASP